MVRRVFITVGEVSGDQHASRLIRELLAADKDLIIEGLGGDAMRAAGAIVHHDTVTRAAMGWKGALRYFELRRLLKWTADHFRRYPPDLQICIDSWSMNWHWAKLAKDNGIPVLYYIAPQLWASRPGRIERLRRFVDRVACILPFEVAFLRERGVEAAFVGHPLFDSLPDDPVQPDAIRFPQRPPVIGILPGSRGHVAAAHLPPMLEVARQIQKKFPDATFLIPTTPATHRVVQRILGLPDTPSPADAQTIGPYSFALQRFDELVRRCDLCLTVSGTSTLHVAAHRVPMIVVYRISPPLWHLLVRWVVKIRTYSLVNLLAGKTIVPEFVPWYGSTAPVSRKALEMLENPALLAEQRAEIEPLLQATGARGASANVAKMALELLRGVESK